MARRKRQQMVRRPSVPPPYVTAPRQDRLAAVPAAQVAAETPAEDLGRLYGHVKRDLIRIALVSGLMFAFIIASKVVLKG